MIQEFSFKPLQESDLNLLCHWLGEPHVKEWWDDHLTDEEINFRRKHDYIHESHYARCDRY